MFNSQSGIGWRDGALGATPGQLHNGLIVPTAGQASTVLCTAQLVGQGVPARFSETANFCHCHPASGSWSSKSLAHCRRRY